MIWNRTLLAYEPQGSHWTWVVFIFIYLILLPCLCYLHSADPANVDPCEQEQCERILATQKQNKCCFYVFNVF